MVAKKTAVQQSASGRSTGPAAKDVSGKKSAQGAPAEGGAAAAKPVKNASKRAAKASKEPARRRRRQEGGHPKAAADDGQAAHSEGARSSKTAAKKAAAGQEGRGQEDRRQEGGGQEGRREEGRGGGGRSGGDGAGEGRYDEEGRCEARRQEGSSSTAKKAVASAAQGAAQAAKTTGATTVVAKKTPGTATAAKKPSAVPKARVSAVVEPGELAVRPGEDPWTPEEVAEARAELQSEALRLSSEISSSEEALAGLMRDSGDGAGDDQADTGTKNITRESEMALAANAREMLEQTERALERLDAGTYGLCENCGNPIGKARMQAFPRATLCVECKQKQERRY